MSKPSAQREAAVDWAANAIEKCRMQMLDRDWNSGQHHLDLVATPGGDILAVVEVRAVAHGTLDACVTAVAEERLRRAADAARAWMTERGGRYEELWAVVAMVDPDGEAYFITGIAEGVA